MTPAQARDLVDHFGSLAAAARAVGVHPTTIPYWLDPGWAERKRAAVKARYDALSGPDYNHLLLRRRRTKALERRRQRSGEG